MQEKSVKDWATQESINMEVIVEGFAANQMIEGEIAVGMTDLTVAKMWTGNALAT